MSSFLIPIVIMTVVALVLGICIVVASKIFYVYENPLIQTVNKLLPGANCGGCGYPGCSGFAKALVETRDTSLGCPVGGQELSQQLGAILGVKLSQVKTIVATVKCQGCFEKANSTADYYGIADCWAVKQTYQGPKECPYSCVGFGSCVSTCAYDAISIKDGVAVIDPEKCIGCGSCVKGCPLKCIEMYERRKDRYVVACRSIDKGGVTRKYCQAGCIGCKRCEKACNFSAVTVVNFCAVIDQKKCTECGECFKVCPNQSILHLHESHLVSSSNQAMESAQDA